jgi:uncharacterized membrane protein YfcA
MITFLLLFCTGLFAGTVDAIAGGGGLISLPVLLSLGIPPHIAFGTNKLQGTLGTSVAALRYYRHGLISLSAASYGILFGLVGSICGAIAGQVASTVLLQKLIPVLLLFILAYVVFSPRVGDADLKPRMREALFYLIFGFILGFYDGFFGPGVGSIWVFCLTFFLGYNLIKATAYTKIFNLNSSLIATFCFAIGGNIDYRLGLSMAAGQLIGGRLGAHFAIKNGSYIIRPIFLFVVATTIMSLLVKTYGHSDIVMRFTRHTGVVLEFVGFSIILLAAAYFYVRNQRQRMQA